MTPRAHHFGPFLTVLLVLATTGVARGQDGLPPEKLAALKEASVQVAFATERVVGSRARISWHRCSGLLVSRDGVTGYVVVPAHAVHSSTHEIRVVLRRGTPECRIVDAAVAVMDHGRDIALLRVEHPELPEPVVPEAPDVREGQFVVTLGRPGGRGEPSVDEEGTVEMAAGVVNELELERGRVQRFKVDSDARAWQGGAVVTTAGALVGLTGVAAGRGPVKAVSARTVQELLHGDLIRVWLREVGHQKGVITLAVHAVLSDPLERVDEVVCAYAPRSDLAEPVDSDRPPSALTTRSGEPVGQTLEIQDGVARGELVLRGDPTEDTFYTFQIQCTRVDGDITHSLPQERWIAFSRAARVAEASGWLGADRPDG